MASPSRNATSSFLPAGFRPFVRRRLVEGAGLAILLAAAALAVALAGYAPGDPSLDTAIAAPAANPLGQPGAVVADLLLQSLGVAAWLVPLTLAAWAWRIGSHRGLALPALHVAALPVALLLAVVALAPLPVPSDWPLRSGLGGVTGMMLAAAVHRASLGLAPQAVVSLAAAVLAAVALVAAFGFGRVEWRAMGRAAWWVGRLGAVTGWRGGKVGWQLGASGVGALRSAGRGRLKLEPRFGPAETDVDIDADTGEAEAPAPRDSRGRREPRLDVPRTMRKNKEREIASEAASTEEGRVAAKHARPTPGKRAQEERQARLDFDGSYVLPPLDLLDVPPPARKDGPSEEALEANARQLETVLEDFGVRGEIVKVRPGPVVTLYELEPAPGIKTSRVIGLADDIARSMSAVAVRSAVVPGQNVIGIELPNRERELVALRELLSSAAFERTAAQLPLLLGKDIGGAPVIVDLARMPHLLVAGTTGSGKSVAINAMICSLLFRLTPEQCKFIMIDPKMLELKVYDGVPHLLAPVVTEPTKAVTALRWAVREMETRYRNMSMLGVRNIAGYNARIAEAVKKGETLSRTVQTGFDPETGAPKYEDQPLDTKPLPFVVVIVDEMADLMLVAGKEVEASVQRLAQMARAAGIHLIMATQRPSVDVITGTIKANFPSRISFQVTSKIDSRTILGESGAEQLLGQGDMLYMAGGGRITRVHGPFVSDDEVERVVAMLRDQGEPVYNESITEGDNESMYLPPAMIGGGSGGEGGSDNLLYDQAVALVCRERKASTSFVQRHLQIGYNRAARLIERMEAEGVISGPNHVGKREVLARDFDDRDR